jgi:colanic acid biosynthesis glycosyl transferase WcaI
VPALPDGFKVMFTGNIGASKDFESVLAAAEMLKDRPDINWVIVGDGHRLEWLRSEIRSRGLTRTVHCLGRFPSSSMPAFFARADVLLATLKDEPVFALTVPAKIQSYLSAGRPIITAINGEVVRIMAEAGAGLAVPASDPQALAGAVRALADASSSEREAMGARGKAYFETAYDRDRLFDQLVGWFKALAEKRGQVRAHGAPDPH